MNYKEPKLLRIINSSFISWLCIISSVIGIIIVFTTYNPGRHYYFLILLYCIFILSSILQLVKNHNQNKRGK